ncbi:ribose 5-phosphate isomerase [Pyrolobus fumarii 1A]|uniref:Ribose 5-phosphate isomerase A n=1 Tax=Pyrolobus fumarii (strain DSM 11204 / 1A) TaxID=694429 RepID=G0EH21_PYRF1|nr:ribose 5-phosphate isomerase A [Pyrolobus fumarii]AEM38471.1 ribose 5-phosphate isomerase [Pyrolobus fumarii 1A]
MGSAGKRVAARTVAEMLLSEFRDARVVGVGTGSTVALVLEELARLDPSFFAGRVFLATSLDTLLRLKSLGASSVSLGVQTATPEVYFDGADEVVLGEGCPAIKGRGAALYLEKLLAHYSSFSIMVVDESKVSKRLGELGKPVPLDADPLALAGIENTLRRMGVRFSLREAGGKDGPVVSDTGGIVIDVDVKDVDDVVALGARLESLPGVRASGVFAGVFDRVVVGYDDGRSVVFDCRRGVTGAEGSAPRA